MSLKAHPDTIEAKTGQTPRKVVAGYFLSLDGVAEAPDRFITAWDDTDASGANLIATQDAVILGRRSYDEWAEFWPGSEIQPSPPSSTPVPKYVSRPSAQRRCRCCVPTSTRSDSSPRLPRRRSSARRLSQRMGEPNGRGRLLHRERPALRVGSCHP
jgi:hypothetical protein